jgi:hypothetical protein
MGLKNTIQTALLLLFINVLLLVIGYNSIFMPETADKSMWFARTGSIVVGLTVIFEFGISRKINKYSLTLLRTHAAVDAITYLDNDNKAVETYDDISNRKFTLRTAERICYSIAHSSLLIGTIIWGYGDLIYPYLLR